MKAALPLEFTPELAEAIVDAIDDAYTVTAEWYDPDLGHDAMLFGIGVWKSSVRFLGTLDEKVVGVSTRVANYSIEMRRGPLVLRAHKLGHTEQDDPWTSFPEHAGPAARMGRQLPLPGFEQEQFFEWVIGHYGNPEDGLRAVYLQAPSADRSADGHITRWAEIVPLWIQDAERPAPEEVAVLPAAVPVPDPALALKPRAVPSSAPPPPSSS